MTLERAPGSIEDILMEVIGQLHVREAAEVTGRSTDYLYALTHPDRREQLSVRDLELLDLEHHARFGKGFLLFEALGRRLVAAGAERFADAAEIGRSGARLCRENGEAVGALMDYALASGDPALARDALRQTEDVAREAAAIVSRLRAIVDRHATGPPDTS